MTRAILHITDASSSGVLASVTTLARAQSATPGLAVTLAYVARRDSPPPEQIRRMAGPDVTVETWARRPRLAVPALLLRTAAALAATRPLLVHLHSSRTGMVGRLVALLTGQRARTVYSPHCFAFDRSDTSAPRRRTLIALERLGGLMGPRLLLVSETEEALARRVLPGVRTAVLRNRVDAAALAARARPSPGPGPETSADVFLVVHVGRIAAQKRPAEFAAVARRWRAAHADQPDRAAHADHAAATFRWLGDGERALLDPSVEISGWLDREDLLAALGRADVLLFTTAGEGLPIAVLEAQALGVPVVAHDVTGVADVVDDGVTGLLRRDAAGLLQALEELAADPARRRALGEQARARVRRRFGLDGLAEDSFAACRRIGIPLGEETP